jgi:hypothetical protein
MADVARRRRCARSTVTRACQRGGPLHPALVADRVDIAHPAARVWLARGSGKGAPGYPEDEVFVGPQGVAELAGCSVEDVYDAVLSGLGDALDFERKLFDVTHPAALAFFARHPLADEDVGQFPLAGAAVGDEIDVDHPHAVVLAVRRGVAAT